jgi:hypothetical protein
VDWEIEGTSNISLPGGGWQGLGIGPGVYVRAREMTQPRNASIRRVGGFRLIQQNPCLRQVTQALSVFAKHELLPGVEAD